MFRKRLMITCFLVVLVASTTAIAGGSPKCWDDLTPTMKQEILLNIRNKLCQSQSQEQAQMLYNKITNNNNIMNKIVNDPSFINAITVNPEIINAPEFKISLSPKTIFNDTREFPGNAPPLFQQYSYGGLPEFISFMDWKERLLLERMLGAAPVDESLSRKMVAKNATSKYDWGLKQLLNEIPFEFLVKGDKGLSNYSKTIEYLEDESPGTPSDSQNPSSESPENPAESQKKPADKAFFIHKMEDGVPCQIVDRGTLMRAGWKIGMEIPINGVAGVWLSGLKWAGYKFLMDAGYQNLVVTAVYRFPVNETSGKSAQGSGTYNKMFGLTPESAAANFLLSMGKGSGQTWESQRFVVVLAGLKPMKKGQNPPKLILTAPPPVVEKKPEVQPKVEKEIVKVPVPVEVNPFENLPVIDPIPFPLNSADVQDFYVDGVLFEGRKALEEAIAKGREKILPLLNKYPGLKLYSVGTTCNYGPKGEFPTQTKEGKKFSNSEAYNYPLGGERAQAIGLPFIQALGISPERTERLSKGIGHPDIKLSELERTKYRSAYFMIGYDLKTAKPLTK
jgi:hypothetical protein